MDAIQQQSMDLAREERRQMRLNTLAAALKRLDGGNEYGACLVCGEDIPYRRLKADPAVTRCVDCAE
jgi:DnaK suppressor protein